MKKIALAIIIAVAVLMTSTVAVSDTTIAPENGAMVEKKWEPPYDNVGRLQLQDTFK